MVGISSSRKQSVLKGIGENLNKVFGLKEQGGLFPPRTGLEIRVN